MVDRHPVHKRILSRVVFYTGVVAYLWVMEQAGRHVADTAFVPAPMTAASLLR